MDTLTLLDLTAITPPHASTHIDLAHVHPNLEWIRLGQVCIQRTQDVWVIKAYLNQGATDPEHSPAQALRLPLWGAHLDGIDSRFRPVHRYTGIIEGNSDLFRVPGPNYNPFAKAIQCPTCTGEDAHIRVPEDFYTPPFNEALFDQVRGLAITISIVYPRVG